MNNESSIIIIIMLWALVIIFNMMLYKMSLNLRLNEIQKEIKEIKIYIEEK